MGELAALMKAELEGKLVKDEVLRLRNRFTDIHFSRFNCRIVSSDLQGNMRLYFQARFLDFLLRVDFFLRQIKFNGVPSKPK